MEVILRGIRTKSIMEMATRSSASSGGEDGDSVGGDEDLMAVYHVLLAFFFIGCLFAFGKLFSLLHGKLIGEIICGFLLGGVLDIVPEQEGWKLIGEMGLTLLVIEGGMHVDLEALKKIGVKALCIGVSGTGASILVSWLILSVFLGYPHLSGISSGVALASTSIGMANTLLKEHKFLDTMLGKTVAAAAVVDDVLPLVLLAVLDSLSEMTRGDDKHSGAELAFYILRPIVSSILILLGGLLISLFVPRLYDTIYRYIKTRKRLCPCRKSSKKVPDYAPPVIGKSPGETEDPVFYHGDDDEGLIPESRVCMQAKHAFNAFDEGQLSFTEGETLEVLEFHPSGWWLGEVNPERIGRFPRSYCEVINEPQCGELEEQEEGAGQAQKRRSWGETTPSRPKEEVMQMASAIVEEDETDELPEPLQAEHPLSISRQRKFDALVLGGLLLYGVLYAALALAVKSTPLLGCFMAGVAFARVPGTHDLWHRHVSPVHKWMISIFFASVGFEIPGEELVAGKLVLYGWLFTIPSIFTKLLTGFFVTTDFPLDAFIIGWAMVGRGELGFLMAERAKAGGILEPDPFIVTVWALVLSTFFAPFMFDYYLRKKRRKELELMSTGERIDEDP